jgi:mono/diheme cytochrome c family protein
MKGPAKIFAMIAIFGIATGAVAEVVVKQKPLTWSQAAVTDGEELYQDLCAVCHGKEGRGDGPAAVALKKKVPDLTGIAARHGGVFPRAEVEDFITGENRVVEHGTVDMPIWGRAFEGVRPDWNDGRRRGFANQRIYNLAEYLSTIQEK